MKKIKQMREKISQYDSVKAWLFDIKDIHLEKIAFGLLMALILSPLYVLFRSLFLHTHELMYFPFNTRALGNMWHTLLLQLGYLALILGLLAALKSYYQRDHIWQYTRKYALPILLFLMIFWSILATVFSPHFKTAFFGTAYRQEGLITYGAYVGFFAAAFLLAKSPHKIKLFYTFILIQALLAIMSILNFESIHRIFTMRQKTAIFHNPNHYGYYLLLGIMVIVILYLLPKTSFKRKSFILLPSYILLVTTLNINGSFGPFIGVFFGLIFMFLFALCFNRNIVKPLSITLLLFLLTSFAYDQHTSYLRNEITDLNDDIGSIIENPGEAGRSGTGRWSLWMHGLVFMGERPIFGYGPDSLGPRYYETGHNNDRPHNEYIQFGASLGIPALTAYIGALALLFLSLFLKPKALPIYLLALSGLIIAYLINAFFGNTMYYTTPYFLLFLGLIMGETTHHKAFEITTEKGGGITDDKNL